MKTECGDCDRSDKGAEILGSFYCFDCMKQTNEVGLVRFLFRDEDGYWKTQCNVDKRQLWLPTFVGPHPCPLEEAYQVYIARLVVK